MEPNLYNFFVWSQLSTAERLALYSIWLPVAGRHNLPNVVAHIERARAHDEQTHTLEIQWKKNEGTGNFEPAMIALDAEVDGLLASIHDMAQSMARAFPASPAIVAAAGRLLDVAFPLKLPAVIRASFIDQAAEVERISRELRGSLAAEVDLLRLNHLVDRLEQLAPQYRAGVEAGRSQLAYADLRAAQQRGLSFVAEIVALVLARYYNSDEPGHVKARWEFLASIVEYDERARSKRRARRRANDSEADIDDETATADDADAASEADAEASDTPVSDDGAEATADPVSSTAAPAAEPPDEDS